MNSIFTLENTKEISSMLVRNEIVTNVSLPFINTVEYSKDEFLGKKISEIFTLLRMGPSVVSNNIVSDADYFLFTKTYQVIFFNISIVKEGKNEIYIFNEIPNSRLEDRFPYLYSQITEDIGQLYIYSVPEFILIKASESALKLLDDNRNNAEKTFGRQIYEIIEDWKGSTTEAIWKEVIQTGKPKCVKEVESLKFQRGKPTGTIH